MTRASSVHDIHANDPPFGSRFLTDETLVFTQNAWDHVPPPTDQFETIAASLTKQRISPVPKEERTKYNEKPAKHWDNFYKSNASNFFKDRKWLHNEFPKLVESTRPEAGPIKIAEIGCGAGNSVFPLLASNQNPHLELYAYDYSNHAVKLVQNNPLYVSPPVGKLHAAVWDLSSKDTLPSNLEEGSVDIVVLVFVLSALHPDEWDRAVSNVHRILKSGGLVLLRDYGRYDLTQLRFKAGRLLDDEFGNFYIRGDKTRVYFFELGVRSNLDISSNKPLIHPLADELSLIFTGARPSSEIEGEENDTNSGSSTPIPPDPSSVKGDPSSTTSPPTETTPEESSTHNGSLSSISKHDPNESANTKLPTTTIDPEIHPHLLKPPSLPHPLFQIEQLGIDRRLIVNRKRQLKMYRVWMQGVFRKVGS
ncbi:methyltransferase [Marasmius fiardii PR-910]|nr:methyltransferase [Marasmius fiardii PR-910]